MKKLFVILLLFVSLVACSPKFYYFTTETTCPQCVVDSLLGPNTSNYLEWVSFETVGVNQGDSTLISTYVNVVDKTDVSVITYENSEKSTVKKKKLK